MADEREEREAQALHRRTISLVEDLRGDANYRLTDILRGYADRRMDSYAEEREVRANIRGDLTALQSRIDQTLSSLR